MSVYISGVGVVSSLGKNYKEHKENLFGLKEGISKNSYENHGFVLESYTGKVQHELKVPEQYQDETRNFKFAFKAFEEALASSGVDLEKYKNIAVCLGTSLGGKVAGQEALYRFESGDHQVEAELLEKTSVHHIADELMDYHGIVGASYVISTACSASNNAVILGTQLLQDGECDLAICGGCDELSDISLAGFTSLGAINVDMPCQPYSSGKGINLGEGAGFVVLVKEKSLAKYGKIIGGLITSDAYHITAPKPTGEGAAQIAKQLVAKAGIDFKDIDYINGHGTGTQANDKMEKNMYTKLFPQTTLISSTKGQTGHTLGAAGIIELINCLAAIEEQAVPATKNVIGMDDFPQNFVYNKKRNHKIKNVLNFSFAFGGNNSGVLLASLDSPLETFAPEEDMKLAILGSASSLQKDQSSVIQYEEVASSFNDFKALRFKNAVPPKAINPAQFRKMDDFSKLVAVTTARALENSQINLKKIDTSKVGIVFTTPSGPVDVVEGIEKQITTEGYSHVSASRFPFTVMNAAAGMLSIMFKIKGPLSVISTNSGAIDGIQYAKEMMKNDGLEYVLLVSAHQWTDMSLMWWEQLGYNSKEYVGADYCSVQVLSHQQTRNNPIMLGSKQLKYSNKTLDEISSIFEHSFKELMSNLHLSPKDIKGIVWNERKKINSLDYDFLHQISEQYQFSNLGKDQFDFSSNGAGEELDFITNTNLSPGYYMALSYSKFGGISFAIIEK
ncbi:beta-ketoacyl-[acyl-carrier-protein] synthase family protein [Streptococcus sinensis]|uniref:beta-ketoacyl-[acyl-carrier-protein] synthase family protein n=1 Tax=Streptococcus sinensis TaxID=176090 RepID=UPI00272C021D|nr:beta-ketoacyl-[acyl-carrier-protein] synthase family protein [Streptococcus sinensis]